MHHASATIYRSDPDTGEEQACTVYGVVWRDGGLRADVGRAEDAEGNPIDLNANETYAAQEALCHA